ncbi:hypothetical protein HZU73_05042 [Apis mellifera caucasica]|uniref:Uncharacterized protein LOC100578246 isoform X1 n=1 Tax=Apis mellifera TaxID=7460 RepID=A0A7M7GIJ6_APIME|nr:uncharacterized protein LOC100578246 isoform X1 [Apis mellifera]KAG6799661.1 hypothetical protein HZU73_05042 [Apis mellifera caucasica]|eukprot:XP_003249420.1 uncharacterized protein LOC100578246 isoform X1 [Apis mellifera]
MTTTTGRYGAMEMRHSRSEDLLGVISGSRSPSPNVPLPSTASEDDLIAASALHEATDTTIKPTCPLLSSRPAGFPADRIDPEDSIRDIVTENDLYRFVLFKRHYDKYVALATKYEEAKGVAYYLEERYHEVKAERDKLEETRRSLEKRLEGCEAELRGKEDELFLQLERSLRLEEEVERAKTERDNCIAARDRLEKQREVTLRRLQMQLAQNEITRQTLERARQDVVRQATVIRAERDALERENEVLKEKLRIEQGELGEEIRRRDEGVAALTRETMTLRHAARHLRAATIHATSCRRRRRCSVCLYARRTFAEVDDYRDDGNLFKCLQAPLQDLRTWLRPSTSATTTSRGQRTISVLADQEIGFIDDSSVDSSAGGSNGSNSSTTSSNSASDDEAYPSTPVAEISLSSANSSVPATARAFSSDSGFSSEIGDRRSRCYENGGSSTSSSSGKSRKISESLSCSEPDEQSTTALTRSRWTSSFRKLLGRKPKTKSTSDRSS